MPTYRAAQYAALLRPTVLNPSYGLEANSFSQRADLARGRNVSVERDERREFLVGNWNRRTSAAAEVLPLSRTSSDRRSSCSTPASCLFTRRGRSSIPTARRRWSISAWPPSIHFLRKRLSYYSPLPSPISGLVDSLNLLQRRGHKSFNSARGRGLRATYHRQVPDWESCAVCTEDLCAGVVVKPTGWVEGLVRHSSQ
jgi:hypothetical protein